MTTRKKSETGKASGKGEGKPKKLQLKKETLKDLSMRKRSEVVKGGRGAQSVRTGCMISCYQECCGNTGSCGKTDTGGCMGGCVGH